MVPLSDSRKSSMEFHKVLFLVHYFFNIRDLPKITIKNTKCTQYADDASMITTNPSRKDFKINTNKAFLDIRVWFKADLLSLNFKKLITYMFIGPCIIAIVDE